ncbi:GNAT family N-acetyltransferase [Sediminibacterium ginsengisoli]|uniref:Acetyltransferase (GNAT) family protein n=1 Tax=Sediminibacterium ginsengisoli TaxID=413434 RepID=A0A1T4M8L9_9BACT|nr:GNAT family N-acetyltransferase [Sediminibacterium ginsengisoli]SJZ63272.1 Acetyltransferase (GNAT) family protein [Sediminibacterium ginsengisoli]
METQWLIRNAMPHEFERTGQLMVDAYIALEAFPGPDEEPRYYQMLANVGTLTEKPGVDLIICISGDGVIAGAVVYFEDMAHYGSGADVSGEKEAAGFRLLAVAAHTRGCGIGKMLVSECIRRAGIQKRRQVIIHSTKFMRVAWGMYERMGFKRAAELDFTTGRVVVAGFRLGL